MTNEMIERVARAIWHSKLLQPARGEWPNQPTTTSEFCKHAARAAIEAMREPTDEMTAAGMQVSMLCGASWQVMIDEALSDAASPRP